jgi:hypothetical protein
MRISWAKNEKIVSRVAGLALLASLLAMRDLLALGASPASLTYAA